MEGGGSGNWPGSESISVVGSEGKFCWLGSFVVFLWYCTGKITYL